MCIVIAIPHINICAKHESGRSLRTHFKFDALLLENLNKTQYDASITLIRFLLR